LIEVYRMPDDPARHKETAHYQAWRDAVADMMAEPHHSVKYYNVFPHDAGWG
jgi:autoinducer 2-degrading protein